MKCLYCGTKTEVTTTISTNNKVTRYRKCTNSKCGKTFTTEEIPKQNKIKLKQIKRSLKALINQLEEIQ